MQILAVDVMPKMQCERLLIGRHFQTRPTVIRPIGRSIAYRTDNGASSFAKGAPQRVRPLLKSLTFSSIYTPEGPALTAWCKTRPPFKRVSRTDA